MRADDSDFTEECSDEEEDAWIPWFCSRPGNDFFCEVDADFIQDSFNLTGLNEVKEWSYYDLAMDMILDIEIDEKLSEQEQELVDEEAVEMYGLVHARYILTSAGLHAMLDKYKQSVFGRCPSVSCEKQSCLPVGTSDKMHKDYVKLYCPNCDDMYTCEKNKNMNVDGAFFGRTFSHLFFLTFPHLKVVKPRKMYEPTVFGYKLHGEAYKRSLDAKNKEEKGKREQKLTLHSKRREKKKEKENDLIEKTRQSQAT